MTEQKPRKRQKLSHEILGLLAVTFAVSFFLYEFLSLAATSIADTYCDRQNMVLTYAQAMDLEMWIFNVSLVTAVAFFVTLFLFLLGQKLVYIQNITKGVEALQARQMDFLMPLEGSNELTQLAEAINYLSATQRQIKEKEKALHEEKEQLIRTLSHDIRTPLTSIMAYSAFLLTQENCTTQERKEHLELIQKKAEQIKELTDILLDGGRRNPERFDDARLLMKQLAEEFAESLEEEYAVAVDLTRCPPFGGAFDVRELRRLFDNLISNIQKYADPEKAVKLSVSVEEHQLIIRQENVIRTGGEAVESHRMGLNSIRRIAHNYGGRVEIQQDDDVFMITIVFSEI